MGKKINSTKKLLCQRRRGAALIMAMIFVIIFSALAVSMAAISGANLQFASNQHEANSALLAAQSGLEIIRYYLSDTTISTSVSPSDKLQALATNLQAKLIDAGVTNIVPNYDAAAQTLTISDVTLNSQTSQSFAVVISQIDADTMQMEITGNGRKFSKTIRVNSDLSNDPIFGYGVITKGVQRFRNGGLLTGYDSGDLSATNVEAIFGTLGTDSSDVWLTPQVTVNGDVFCGLYGVPEDVIDSGVINGQTYAIDEQIDLPDVTAPVLTYMGTHIDVGGNTTLTISPAQNGEYTGINVGNNAILEITGGDVVLHLTGDIRLSNHALINITPSSSLTIYLDGDMRAGNWAKINNLAQIPANFILYGTGTGGERMTLLNNAGDFYGIVYAPNADVRTNNSSNIYGSITAKTFDAGNNCSIYYDRALRSGNGAVGELVLEYQPGSYSEPSL